jgi:hypothetical protein
MTSKDLRQQISKKIDKDLEDQLQGFVMTQFTMELGSIKSLGGQVKA